MADTLAGLIEARFGLPTRCGGDMPAAGTLADRCRGDGDA